MENFSVLSALISLLPALGLCIYIYAKDRVEKEPFSLLSVLFGCGVLAYLPTLFCERKLTNWFDMLFAGKIQYTVSGIETFTDTSTQLLHNSLCAFIGIALLEESVKWLLLYFITHKNRNFNCLFDGIVYSVFISLGFSIIESVRFAVIDGWDTLILRALTSIPTHILFGIITGMFYTVWHALDVAKEEETKLFDNKTIKSKKVKCSHAWIVMSYLVPIIIHGLYCLIELSDNRMFIYIYYLLMVILYMVGFATIHTFSKHDSKNTTLSKSILRKYHPELIGLIDEEMI